MWEPFSHQEYLNRPRLFLLQVFLFLLYSHGVFLMQLYLLLSFMLIQPIPSQTKGNKSPFSFCKLSTFFLVPGTGCGFCSEPEGRNRWIPACSGRQKGEAGTPWARCCFQGFAQGWAFVFLTPFFPSRSGDGTVMLRRIGDFGGNTPAWLESFG